jgi:uncharacterized protein with HEPN domain
MNEKAKKYLSDILQAIDLIEEFVSDVPTFEDYLTDQKTQSAVERQLGIIGEAVNKFRQVVNDHELTNATEIVGFRNRLIHNYDGLDETIVWAVIQNHLPKLKDEVKEELED